MSTSAESKTHYQAIAYTATFLGILLSLFLVVVFANPSKSVHETIFLVETEPGGAFTKEDSPSPDNNFTKIQTADKVVISSSTPVVTDDKETVAAINNPHDTKNKESIIEPQPNLDPNLKTILERANVTQGTNTKGAEPVGTKATNGIFGTKDGISDKTKGPLPYELSGRTLLKKPEQISGITEEGTVVVEILVNKMGKVIKAVPGQRGSTTTNSQLYAIAAGKAKEAEFDSAPEGIEEQRGTYTFVFRLE